MAALLELYEEELGYTYDARTLASTGKERRRVETLRQMSGQERVSRQSRHSRRSAPTRQSGAHRRGNKRYGI